MKRIRIGLIALALSSGCLSEAENPPVTIDPIIEAEVKVEPSLVVTAVTQPKLPGIGDALLLFFPSGETMLIDTGVPGAYDSHLFPALERHGIRDLTYLVITHAHFDHDGSALKVVEKFKGTLREVWHNGSQPNAGYLRAALAAGIVLRSPKAGETVNIGSVRFDVVHPGSKKYQDENDNSLVFRASHAGDSMLFTGDIETASQNAILERYGPRLRSTYLKVPHHGSAKFSDDFISAVGAETALCSCRTIPAPSLRLRNLLKATGTEFLSNRDEFDAQVIF